MTTTLQKIYGIEFEEILVDGKIMWEIKNLHHPFRQADGRLRIGLNEKFLRGAIRRGVEKFIWGNRLFDPPTERELKEKARAGERNWQNSIFEGRQGFWVYHFFVR